MTFDELMDKYTPLIAGAVTTFGVTGERDFDHLVEALMEDLRPALGDGENLQKGAEMAAHELMNRYEDKYNLSFPDLGGGFSSLADHPDTDYGADEPAPSIQVSIRQPDLEEMEAKMRENGQAVQKAAQALYKAGR